MKKITGLLAVFSLVNFLVAQENVSYQKPPKEILELVDIERAPSINIDSKNENILFTYRKMYKNLEDLSQEEMRLGGLRINPKTNISSTVTYVNNLKLRKFKATVLTDVTGLPTNPKIANISWSPNEKFIAFTHTSDKGVELWLLDVDKAQAKKWSNDILNANMGNPITWFKNSESVLIKVLPTDRPALIQAASTLPNGPTVSISEKGAKAQNRTYADLLKNKMDEANFENIMTSELKQISLDGTSLNWKAKNLYLGVSFSPDGQFALITTLQKPFSYIVQYSRFPMKQTVYDQRGKTIKEVNDIPLTEVMPKGFMATRTGKRDLSWRSDKAATLSFVMALDGGDPEQKVDFRDELFSWDAPFDKEPISLMKTIQRYSGVEWGTDDMAIVSDDWWNTRNTKTYLFNPSNPAQKPTILFDRSSEDKYSDPGSFDYKKNQYGSYVLNIVKDEVCLIGEGHTEKGQFPFIDKLNLKTNKKVRLYQSAYTNKKESIISILDIAKGEALIMLESANEYPNYFVRNIKSKKAPYQLTFNANPFKSIANIHKEVIKYKRADGVELSGTLYLPVGYDKTKKEKLPMIMWAYPQEYKDKNSAGQVTQNPNEFTFPNYGTPLYWVTRGYVVLDDAAFPILGEGTTEPNDNFIEQLVSNAQAAIDAVDKLGYIDRTKVAVGGHSYGAFMTANLLTHSNLFACGVARSGAYNRTLTPFGFQSEERSYWDVPEIYNTMSPFMNADKMKTPLLLVHGEADNNPGTFTLQSERYFNALKGLGNPARLVILPKESHGYAAIENILHLLWEQDQWFEKHLKGSAK
ncbi:MAG: prolyl oligopeptidase family serine peptidase [Flavobacteriia bacterium]|jgi:dipeptidyl aminopeptidase/acylaminoacyl peptidase